MDFEHFNQVIEEKKVDIVQDKYQQNYVLMVLVNSLNIFEIGFDSFELKDIWDIYNHLEEAITDESMNGEVALDPKHPYTRMIQFGYKISEFEVVPKERVPSPFMFL
jgi:hypothetical protein